MHRHTRSTRYTPGLRPGDRSHPSSRHRGTHPRGMASEQPSEARTRGQSWARAPTRTRSARPRNEGERQRPGGPPGPGQATPPEEAPPPGKPGPARHGSERQRAPRATGRTGEAPGVRATSDPQHAQRVPGDPPTTPHPRATPRARPPCHAGHPPTGRTNPRRADQPPCGCPPRAPLPAPEVRGVVHRFTTVTHRR